jgi:hypothetical protein
MASALGAETFQLPMDTQFLHRPDPERLRRPAGTTTCGHLSSFLSVGHDHSDNGSYGLGHMRDRSLARRSTSAT